MRCRALVTVGLVVLLVLSGCSFLSGDSAPATPDQPTFQGNASAIEFPAGTDERRIFDGQELTSQHVRALAGGSYEIRVRENISVRGNRINRLRTVASSLEGEQLHLTIEVPNSPEAGDRYLDNRTLYSRTIRNETTEYERQRANVSFGVYHVRQTFSRTLALLFGFGQFEAVGTVDRNGETLIEYRLSEASLNARRAQNGTITSSEGRVLVGQDGLIHLAQLDVQGREGGEPFFATIEYEVTAQGNDTSVSEPDWLSRVPATANGTSQNSSG